MNQCYKSPGRSRLLSKDGVYIIHTNWACSVQALSYMSTSYVLNLSSSVPAEHSFLLISMNSEVNMAVIYRTASAGE